MMTTCDKRWGLDVTCFVFLDMLVDFAAFQRTFNLCLSYRLQAIELKEGRLSQLPDSETRLSGAEHKYLPWDLVGAE